MILKDVLGEPLTEIAELMGTSVDAVKAHLARGRARIRTMDPDGGKPPAPPSEQTQRFAALFNQRDWPALRALLAEDVRLREIFGQYARRLPAYLVTLLLTRALLGLAGLAAVVTSWLRQPGQKAQFDRLRAWALSDAVRTADLVFVVVPVPPAMLPIAQLEELASALAAPVGGVGGGLLGAVVGATIGFVVGGPAGVVVGAEVGAGIGAFAGAVGTKVYYEHLEDTITEPDVRDAWTYDKNLPDLVRLLDVLFDVANDIGADGKPGPRPKGVFVLSGDYHFGAIHLVRSKRTGDGHDHRNNPALVQITSSPISKPPVDADLMLRAAAIVSTDDEFKLDNQHYAARFVGHLEQRNFGRVEFEQVGNTRRYRMQLYQRFFDESGEGFGDHAATV